MGMTAPQRVDVVINRLSANIYDPGCPAAADLRIIRDLVAAQAAEIEQWKHNHAEAVKTIRMGQDLLCAFANDMRAAGCDVALEPLRIVNVRAEAAESKLAERDAEIEFVRSALRNRGEYIEGQPPLPLALVAYDHMRIRAEAAERAREEAVEMLSLVNRYGLDAFPLGGPSVREQLAVYLAANGGG